MKDARSFHNSLQGAHTGAPLQLWPCIEILKYNAIRYTQYDIRNTQYEMICLLYPIYAIRNTQYDIRNTQYDIRLDLRCL